MVKLSCAAKSCLRFNEFSSEGLSLADISIITLSLTVEGVVGAADAVGSNVGCGIGTDVGTWVGTSVGTFDGKSDGAAVGA